MMRLDKLLCHSGLGTRTEVKKIIQQKRIYVDGQIVKKGDIKVDENLSVIEVDGQRIQYQPYLYMMLNKPAGYISATEDHDGKTVLSLLPEYDYASLFPVGRLDKDTEGLLLLTNDGVLAHRLLSPKHHHGRRYYAKIEGVVTVEDVLAFQQGVILDDGYRCLEAHLDILNVDEKQSDIEVEVYEGKFHQVKRMFEARHKKVIYLKRIQMHHLCLDPDLPLGKYRFLTKEEIDELKQ